MLKLLAVELHGADMASSHHRDSCQCILAELFGLEIPESGIDKNTLQPMILNSSDIAGIRMMGKNKVMLAAILNCHQMHSSSLLLFHVEFICLLCALINNSAVSSTFKYWYAYKNKLHRGYFCGYSILMLLP